LKKAYIKYIAAILVIALSACTIPNINDIKNAVIEKNYSSAADPTTAHTHSAMLGSGEEGNRYSGRIWVDKSVYTDSAHLDGLITKPQDDFLVVWSALGSTTTDKLQSLDETSLDVVLVMDVSSSMARYVNSSSKITRLERVVEAANGLISQIRQDRDNRIAVVTYSSEAQTLLPLDTYADGLYLELLYKSSKPGANLDGSVDVDPGDAVLTARQSRVNCYLSGTNMQDGISRGFGLLAKEHKTEGRTPVVIILTDGIADCASTDGYYSVQAEQAVCPANDEVTAGVALSTLMSGAYMKSAVENNYQTLPRVYSVGVELDEGGDDAFLVMDPASAFKDDNNGSAASLAHKLYTRWVYSDVNVGGVYDGYRWQFDQLSRNDKYNVSKEQIQDNIRFIDACYDITDDTEQLERTFSEIYTQISSPVFNPIVSQTDDVGGGDATEPLTYVDTLGRYMELKDFEYLTVFGKVYFIKPVSTEITYTLQNGVLNQVESTVYTVDSDKSVRHPILNRKAMLSESISITLKSVTPGNYFDGEFVPADAAGQTLTVKVTEDVLPLTQDIVTTLVEDEQANARFSDNNNAPLRLYYHVGLCDYVKTEKGDIDLSKIDAAYLAENMKDGKVSFYCGYYDSGDNYNTGSSYVSFTPSDVNRYYYHQQNNMVYGKLYRLDDKKTLLTREDGDRSHWGILFEDNLQAEPLRLSQVHDVSDIWTVMSWYENKSGTAESVEYYAYTTWDEIALYTVLGYVNDKGETVYLNYKNGKITEGSTGYAVDLNLGANASNARMIAALTRYGNAAMAKSGKSADQLYVFTAVGADRVAHLSEMSSEKSANTTGTSRLSYAPFYNTSTDIIGDVITRLGNNGSISVPYAEGIVIINNISRFAQGDVPAQTPITYVITSDLPDGTMLTASLIDSDGSRTSADIVFNGGKSDISLLSGQVLHIADADTAGHVFAVSMKKSDSYGVARLVLNGITAQEGVQVTVQPGRSYEYDYTVSMLRTADQPKPVSLSLQMKQTMEGRQLQSGEFVFTLTEIDSPEKDAAEGAAYYHGISDKKGTITFEEITYDYPGTYCYHAGVAIGSAGGVQYDTDAYHIEVEVIEKNGRLQAEVVSVTDCPQHENSKSADSFKQPSGGKTGIIFSNKYTAEPVELQIVGSLQIRGRKLDDSDKGKFVFGLFKGNRTVSVTSNDIDGNIVFSPQIFTLKDAGVHVYTIKEQAYIAEGISSDETVYQLIVNVTDNADGTLSVTADVMLNGAEYDMPVFVNTYGKK